MLERMGNYSEIYIYGYKTDPKFWKTWAVVVGVFVCLFVCSFVCLFVCFLDIQFRILKQNC